ncbi:MAG: DNA polymerase III subunit delta' [Nitrospinae bacterium]|nr:DNA polymerase III subunit delta' [Nitrospinota bacterium]MZH04417.1 DNA polymerase III subunit delta' [Nitrospinota bacterium]MZH14787.1 DNA polymerase III subunit delta' [Nitrospinota bacterium]
MAFNRILGQEKPKQILKNALQNSSVAHAYLFYGQESIGKKKAAIELAKALNCGSSIDGDPCDQCSSCRKIENNTHPDFFFLEPLKSTPTAREAIIKIEAIRELQRKLAYQPYEGKVKVAVIDDADLMNLQAANSFLKTLEEPPSSTLLILISSHPFKLLPTIISRCQTIRFQPLNPENIKRILKETVSEEMAEDSTLDFRTIRSRGSVKKALTEDMEDIANIREEMVNLLQNISFDRMDIVFSHAKSWARQSDQWEMILNELMELVRDIAFFRSGCSESEIFNRDIASTLKPLAARRSVKSWLEMFNAVHTTKAALSGNANAQLFFENMLIDFCKVA